MFAAEKKLISVARIVKSFGQDGEVLLRYSPLFSKDINQKEPVFIFFDELPVPFFIESIKNRGNRNAIAKLETISDQDMADELTGAVIYIEPPQTEEDSGNEFDSITGYTVQDALLGRVGTVSRVYPYPNNPCLGILSTDGSKEHLLPIHEDIVKFIDHTHKQIEVTAPKRVFD